MQLSHEPRKVLEKKWDKTYHKDFWSREAEHDDSKQLRKSDATENNKQIVFTSKSFKLGTHHNLVGFYDPPNQLILCYLFKKNIKFSKWS